MISAVDANEQSAVAARRLRPVPIREARSRASAAIRKACRLGLTSTVIDVPCFVAGHPRFDVSELVAAMTSELENSGYRVHAFPDSPSISVCWGAAIRSDAEVGVDSTDAFDVGL